MPENNGDISQPDYGPGTIKDHFQNPALSGMRYNEALTTGELKFLIDKESKERRQYYVAFRALMILSFIIPFIASWYRAYEGAPNAFSFVKFFASATVIMGISGLATYLSYKTFHRKLQHDIRDKTKTIETTHITRKVTVPSRNACYFYTASVVKLSIEVSIADYKNLDEGDEVSLEYSTHAHFYFGYF